jgi:hypothetical protein
MARAIVRYSCDSTGPAGKYAAEKARASMRSCLESNGFTRVGATGRGTASWERGNPGVTTAQLATALSCVIAVIQGLAPGVLDHIWIYCDE